jgi:hypothetical protein
MIKSYYKDGITYLYKVTDGEVGLIEVHAGSDYIPKHQLDIKLIEQQLKQIESGQVGVEV